VTPFLQALREIPDQPGAFGARRRALWTKALGDGLFGVVPLLVTGGVLLLLSQVGYLAYDFHHSYWQAARGILNGTSLYGRGGAASSAEISAYVSHSLTVTRTLFVYPAPAALLVVPFGFLPHVVADWVFTFICIAAVLGALWTLGIRDWRVYGVTMLWGPVISGYQNGNLSLLIVLGTALAWRYRDRPAVSGLMIAVMVAIKLYAWPLGIWLLATRRYAALAYAIAGTAILNLIAWAMAGSDQVSRYVHLMSALTRIERSKSFSILSLALHHGASVTVAYAIAAVIAAAAAVVCLVNGRRGNDQSSFVWGVGVTLLATPVIWSHYYALLLVPLAIVRPRLSAIWVIALLLWIPVAGESWESGSWQLVIGLLLVGVMFAVAVRDSSDHSAAWAGRGPAHRGPLRAQLQQNPQESAAAGSTNA
jgi:hypothetical protein